MMTPPQESKHIFQNTECFYCFFTVIPEGIYQESRIIGNPFYNPWEVKNIKD